MANDIYLCFECGTKNRVPATANRIRAKCAKCKTDLFPEEESEKSSVTPRAPKGGTPPTSARTPPSHEGAGKAKLIIGLVVAGIIVAVIVSNNESDRRSPSQTATSPATQQVPAAPLPPAVFQTAGVIFNRTGASGNHPFVIVTSAGNDYFVKLVDSSTGAERIGIFVKGGQRLKVEVPAGQYRMRYASGDIWRGMQHLFGPGNMTNYQTSSNIFNFNISGGSYRGYTVELIRQAGGNMDTRSISASSF